MTDLETMFEKMLEKEFPVVTEDNRTEYPMNDYVESLWVAFVAGYNSNRG